MALNCSKLRPSGGSYHVERLRHMKCEEEVWVPPMLFNEQDRSRMSSEDDDDEPDDKSQCAVFKIPFDPHSLAEKKDTFERKAMIFEEGTPEDCLELCRVIEALVKQLGCMSDAEEVSVERALLAGSSIHTFEEQHKQLMTKNAIAGPQEKASDLEVFNRAPNNLSARNVHFVHP